MARIQVMEKSPQQFDLEFNGVTVGTLTRKGLKALLRSSAKLVATEQQKTQQPKKKRAKRKLTDVAIEDKELLARANQLGRCFRVSKLKFYTKRKNPKPVGGPFSHQELQWLKRAVMIMDAHGVTDYRNYIKAQVEGLRFLNGGKGLFPSIRQLCTDSAENRLLNYLSAVRDESGGVIEVEITDEERETPLNHNMKYLTKRDRIMQGCASREDVVYVMNLQNIRRGRVESYVVEYLDQLSASE